ncbi:MAG: segregation/condensation protein A [Pseudomonadota bacterium]|nr:segregation/condensation protein A [Pseudomonadota bacterium]
MSEAHQLQIDFEAADVAAECGDALIVDLDGYEGPLHVLLALARGQKVDLLKLSVTRLADQYLAFVREARTRRFALAADYLVMAAWLAYLKSRLLLPRPERAAEDEAPPEAVAARLAFRLARLGAMRDAAEALKGRPILGQSVFARGDPQAIRIVSHSRLEGDLFGLMAAYIGQKKRQRDRRYRPAPLQAYRLDDARERLRGLLPELGRWTPLSGVAPPADEAGPSPASCLASTLSASLELVREGDLEARQLDRFAEVYLRARKAAA